MSKAEIKLRVGRSTLTRIHFIHSAIKSGQYPNVPKLARTLEMSTRAIERDLELMRDLMGAPIVYSYNRKGYYELFRLFSEFIFRKKVKNKGERK